ncbi:DUF3634 domain-containing protein [Haloferula helveola]|uniref:DUF3634 domain-containing protein n=1 Tax=Haloferula helveola TaxID=490095 RepID=A0ABM7RES1_9BACT|nr:DUF3634 domain-containing protein [Haloferula helveola]
MLWLQKLLNPTVITIRDGRASMAKGRISGRIIRDLDEILADFGITRGTIAIDGTGRIQLSSSIPPSAHQRLRNLLSGT